MARIPVIQPREKLPARGISPGIAGAPGAALEGLGQSIARVGAQAADVVATANEKMKRARQVTQLSNAEMSVLKEFSDLEEDFKTRTDFDNFQPEFDKKKKELRKHHRKNIADPEVLDAFHRSFERTVLKRGVAVKGIARRKEIDFGRASYLENLKGYENMLTGSEYGRKQAIDNARGLIAGNVEAGYITALEGEKDRQSFAYAVVRTGAWNTAKGLGFDAGIKWLQDEKNTPDLEKADRNSMIATLKRDWGLQTRQEDEARENEISETQNLLNQQFRVDGPNKVWVSDITYIWTMEGWLYLAVILDLFSRQIVGWAMSSRITQGIVISAFLQAAKVA